jgi:hypothetical protein
VTRRTAYDAFKTSVQQLNADKLKLAHDLVAADTSLRVLEQRLMEERGDKMMAQLVGQLQEQVTMLRAENADRLGEAGAHARQHEEHLAQEREQNMSLRSQVEDARQQAAASAKLCLALQAKLDAAQEGLVRAEQKAAAGGVFVKLGQVMLEEADVSSFWPASAVCFRNTRKELALFDARVSFAYLHKPLVISTTTRKRKNTYPKLAPRRCSCSITKIKHVDVRRRLSGALWMPSRLLSACS